MTERLYPEITCPYCRIQLGGYKIWGKDNKTVEHFDPMYSQDAGATFKCEQQEYVKANIDKIDNLNNPVFIGEFQFKLDKLKEKFISNPDDIDKTIFPMGTHAYAMSKSGMVKVLADSHKITEEYVDELNHVYNHFFFHYDDSPLLIINTSDIDFVKNKEDEKLIVDAILNMKEKREYLRPLGSKILD